MKMQSKVVLIVSGATMAAAAAMIAARGAPERPAPSTARGPMHVVAAVDEERDARRCRIPVGDERSYAIEIVAHGAVHPRGLGSAATTDLVSDRTETASLHLHGLADEGDTGTVVLARLADVTLDGHAADPSTATPFLFRLAPNCAIGGFARRETLARVTARAQQALVHELLWRFPQGASEEADGHNGLGRYRAAYRRTGDSADIELSVLAYTQIWAEEVRTYTPDESAGRVVAGSGWFETFQKSESLRGLPLADSRATVKATRVETPPRAFDGVTFDPAGYLWQDLLPQTTLVSRAERPVTKADRAAQAAARGQPVATAIERHEALAKTRGNFAELWRPLSTYLEANPEETGTVVGALRRRAVAPEGIAAGWVAVGQARTDEAREALLGVLRDSSVPAIDRTRATFAMVDRDDVGLPFAHELAQHASVLGTGASQQSELYAREAALALGMFANLREASAPPIYSAARASLTSLLATQKTASALHAVFGAIGNLGDASMLAAVRPYTQSKEDEVRLGAAQVFRRLQPEDSTQELASWLARETEPRVKTALYQAIERQSLDAKRAYEAPVLDRAVQDLATAKSILERRAIIKVLGPAVLTYAPAREALKTQARKEYEARSKLFQLISSYLPPEDAAIALEGAK